MVRPPESLKIASSYNFFVAITKVSLLITIGTIRLQDNRGKRAKLNWKTQG
jgi:hypothetical protein